MKTSFWSWRNLLAQLGMGAPRRPRRQRGRMTDIRLGMRRFEERRLLTANLAIQDVSVTEGQTANVHVTLSAPQATTVMVSYATAGNSAATGMDFTSTSGSLMFMPGQTDAVFSVSTMDDIMVEGTESLYVNLSNATPANMVSITRAQGIVTILDNDAPAATPNISVALAGGAAVADDSGFVDFGTTTVGTPASKTFSISNPGNATLTLQAPTLPVGFALVGTFPASVAAGQSQNFTLQLSAAAAGSYMASPFSFSTNVAGHNPYNFMLSGVVNGAPEISASLNAADLPDNTGIVDFGSTPLGTSVSKTITVTNSGSAALTLTNPAAPAGYTITTPLPGSIAAGGSAVLTIRLDATAGGTFNSHLSFATNDSDENPFDFDLRGMVTLPVVTITASDPAASETPGDPGQFTVTRTGGGTSTPLTVMLGFDGGATSGNDYSAVASSVVIAAGQTSAVINITPIDDNLVEGTETVVAHLMTSPGYTVGAAASATVSIADNDFLPIVTLATSDSTASEAGPDSGVFTVIRTGSTATPLTVQYGVTLSSGAVNGGDFNLLNGTVVIPTGQSSVTIVVTPIDDQQIEGTETVTVSLTASPASYSLGATTSGQASIADNDVLPTVSVSASDAQASESGPDSGRFTITRTGPATTSLTVFYTLGGDALSGFDYQAPSGSVTLAAGQSSADLVITPIDDWSVEPAKTVQIQLTSHAEYQLGASTASLIISDNDVPATLSVSGPTSVTEPSGSAATTVSFTVSLSAPTDHLVSATLAPTGGTAVMGEDYTPGATAALFAPGETSKTITLNVAPDSTYEPDEIAHFSLYSADATVAGGSVDLTILNDDPLPTISINNGSTNESGGAGAMGLSVQLSNPSYQNISFTYTTQDGTATQPSDYASDTSTITIMAGAVQSMIPVGVVNDLLDEPDETMTVSLSNPVNATLGGSASGTLTIVNDDAAPSVMVMDAAAPETAATMSFLVVLAQPSGKVVTVQYQAQDDSPTPSAVAGVNYDSRSGTLTFEPGQTQQSIDVALHDNSVYTSNLTFKLVLSSPSNATVGRDSAVGTIYENDPPPPMVTAMAVQPTASEHGPVSGIFRIVRAGGDMSVPLTVHYTLGGTATNGSDYEHLDTSVVFAAGQASIDVNVSPLSEDPDYRLNGEWVYLQTQGTLEGPETVVLTLTSPASPNDYVLPPDNHPVTVTIVDLQEVVAVDDSYTVDRNQLLIGQFSRDPASAGIGGQSLTANDMKTGSGALLVQLTRAPEHGTATIAPDGEFTYSPQEGFVGSDTFEYSAGRPSATPGAADNVGLVTIVVKNNAPVAQNDGGFVTVHDRPLFVNWSDGVLKNDSDADHDLLKAYIWDTASHGNVTLQENGSFVYLPDAGYVGPDRFSYLIWDDQDSSEKAFVTLQVTNSLPQGLPDQYSMTHDTGTLFVSLDTGVLENDLDNNNLDGNVNPDPSNPSADSDRIRARLVQGPQHAAEFEFRPSGAFYYRPQANWASQDGFTYQITDGTYHIVQDDQGNDVQVPNWSAPIGVSIWVNNAPPQVLGETYQVLHDNRLIVAPEQGLLANDSDPDGDALTLQVTSQPATGELRVNAGGSFDYLPGAHTAGPVSFTYTVRDGVVTSQPVTVTIAVLNQMPTALDDAYVAQPGRLLTVLREQGVLGNDYDDDGDRVTVELLHSTTHGELTFLPSGAFAYQPAAGFVGMDSFTYQISDGVAPSRIATAMIQVVGMPVPPPVAMMDQYQAQHDRPLLVDSSDGVLANDNDPAERPLTAALVTPTLHGTLALDAAGAFWYQPQAGYVGFDSFSYLAAAGNQQSQITTVMIQVTDTAPLAAPDTYQVEAGSSLNVWQWSGVLANDSDAEEEPLTASLLSGPAHGSLTLLAGGAFIYTPVAGYVGLDVFQYTVSDGVLTSMPTTVMLNVTPAAATTLSAATRTYSVLHREAISATPSYTETVLEESLFTESGLAQNWRSSDGVWSLALPFAFRYFGADYNSLKISSHGFIALGEVALSAAPQNDASLLTQRRIAPFWDASLRTDDAAYDIFVDASSSDRVAIRWQGSSDSGLVNASVTLFADGRIRFDYGAGNTGATPTIGLSAGDGQGFLPAAYNRQADLANAHSLLYQPVESAVADQRRYRPGGNGSVSALDEGLLAKSHLVVRAVNGLLADFLTDSSLPVVQILQTTQHGLFTLAADGSFTYTPNAGFVGADSLQYRLVSGSGASMMGMVNIHVQNTPPQTQNDAYRVQSNSTLNVSVRDGLLANDEDAETDALMITAVAPPTHGTLIWSANGAFSYTPDAGFSGTDTFTYQASDGVSPVWSAPVTITVQTGSIAVIDDPAPVSAADDYSTPHDQPLVVSAWSGLLANDPRPTSRPRSVELLTDALHGSLTLSADGSFLYVPTAGYVGPDSFTYRVSDGSAFSAASIVTLHVTDNAPSAVSFTESIHTSDVLIRAAIDGLRSHVSDTDGDRVTFQLLSTAAHGALVLGVDGSYRYAPQAGFVGDDQFTYRAWDGALHSDGLVTIHVTNQAPAAENHVYDVQAGSRLLVSSLDGLLANASDADQDSLQAVLTASPAHGTLDLQANGGFSYTPDSGFTGADQFSFRVTDGFTTGNAGVVHLVVSPPSVTVPVPPSPILSTPHDRPLFVYADEGLLSSNVDTAGNPVATQLVLGPAHGQVVLHANGTFIYTPNAGYTGSDGFSYRIVDGAQASAPGYVSINVTNSLPGRNIPDFSVIHDETLLVDSEEGLLPTGDDSEGDLLTVSLVDGPSHGTLTLKENGAFSYRPNGNFVGTDSFTYQYSDGVADGSQKTATIHVVNHAPVAVARSFTVRHDDTLFVSSQTTPVSQGLWNGAFNSQGLVPAPLDADGDRVTAQIVTGAAHGAVTLNSDGSFVYRAVAGYIGPDYFTYVLSDGLSTSAAATVSLTVTNEIPQAGGIRFFTVDHNGLLSIPQSDLGLLAGVPQQDDDLLTTQVLAAPATGVLRLELHGGFLYTPDGSFVGDVSFTYTVSDGFASSIGSAVIHVTNRAPQGDSDSYMVAAGQTLTVGGAAPDALHAAVLMNDSDSEFDSLTAALVEVPAAGSGTLDFHADGTFTFTPAASAVQASFAYAVSDGHGGTSGPIRVYITVVTGVQELTIPANIDEARKIVAREVNASSVKDHQKASAEYGLAQAERDAQKTQAQSEFNSWLPAEDDIRAAAVANTSILRDKRQALAISLLNAEATLNTQGDLADSVGLLAEEALAFSSWSSTADAEIVQRNADDAASRQYLSSVDQAQTLHLNSLAGADAVQTAAISVARLARQTTVTTVAGLYVQAESDIADTYRLAEAQAQAAYRAALQTAQETRRQRYESAESLYQSAVDSLDQQLATALQVAHSGFAAAAADAAADHDLAVAQAKAAYNAALAAASAAYQAGDLDQSSAGSLDLAGRPGYLQAVADAQLAYDNQVAVADAAFRTRSAAARAVFEAAVQSARDQNSAAVTGVLSAWHAAEQSAENAYRAAMAAAVAAHDGGMHAARLQLESQTRSAYISYAGAAHAANAALDSTIISAEIAYADALASTTAAYDQQLRLAQLQQDNTLASAESALYAALHTASTTHDTSEANAAKTSDDEMVQADNDHRARLNTALDTHDSSLKTAWQTRDDRTWGGILAYDSGLDQARNTAAGEYMQAHNTYNQAHNTADIAYRNSARIAEGDVRHDYQVANDALILEEAYYEGVRTADEAVEARWDTAQKTFAVATVMATRDFMLELRAATMTYAQADLSASMTLASDSAAARQRHAVASATAAQNFANATAPATADYDLAELDANGAQVRSAAASEATRSIDGAKAARKYDNALAAADKTMTASAASAQTGYHYQEADALRDFQLAADAAGHQLLLDQADAAAAFESSVGAAWGVWSLSSSAAAADLTLQLSAAGLDLSASIVSVDADSYAAVSAALQQRDAAAAADQALLQNGLAEAERQYIAAVSGALVHVNAAAAQAAGLWTHALSTADVAWTADLADLRSGQVVAWAAADGTRYAALLAEEALERNTLSASLAAADAALQNHWADAAVDRVGDDRRAWGVHDGALALRWVAWLAEQGQIEAAFQQDGGAAFGGLAAGVAAARGAFVSDLAAARVAEMSGFNLADDAFLQSLAAGIVARAQAAGQAAVSLAEQTADADSALAAALAGSLRTLLRSLADADEAGQRAEADLAVTLAGWLGDAQVAWTTSAHNAWRDYVRDTTLADAPLAAAGSAALRDTRIRSAAIALAAENELAGPRATAAGLIAAAQQASDLTTTQAKADRKVNETDERLQLILVKPANEFTYVRPERPRTAADDERDYKNGLLDALTAGWTEDMRRRDTGRWNYSVDTTSSAYAWGRGTGNAVVFTAELATMSGCTWVKILGRVISYSHGTAVGVRLADKAIRGEKFTLTDYIDLVSVAINVFGMVGRMRGLLSGCFVAETEVYVRLQPGQATMVDAAPAADSSAEWTFVALASMGVAVAVQQREKIRRSRKSAAEGGSLPGDRELDCADSDKSDGEASQVLPRRRLDFLPENEYGIRWRSYPLPEPRVRQATKGLGEAQSRSLPGEIQRLKAEYDLAAPSPGGCAATLSRKGRGNLGATKQSQRADKAQPASGSRFSRWLPTVLLLFAAFCGWRALPDSWRMGADVRPAAAVVNQHPLFTPVPIETVRCGQKVLASNPTGDEDLEFGEDVDPGKWKLLALRAAKTDGSWCDIRLLRPDWWLEEEDAQLGGAIHLSVPECGIDGPAEVLEISPCPPILDGPGRVVTGTFKHHKAKAIDVYVAGLTAPIGCTGNHPFWSEDRQDFVRADSLRSGERLGGLAGSPAVVKIVPRAAPETVYNLEVQVDHTYHVTTSGLLVHNGTPCPQALFKSAALQQGGKVVRTSSAKAFAINASSSNGQSASFTIRNWAGYPSGIPKPKGPFRLLQGAEYDAARKAANQANAALRNADPAKYAGKQIHEIHPVKFGGSPTDPANKIALSFSKHHPLTTWWKRLQKTLE